MKVDILTREYPPHVYGGAGVHAEELSKVLAERIDVTVRAFDGKRTEADIPAIPNAANAKGSLKVVGYDTPSELADANPALKTFGVDLQIANDVMPTLFMRTLGMPAWLVTWPRCCTVRRWSSPPTPWNRSAHGSVSSLVAATT